MIRECRAAALAGGMRGVMSKVKKTVKRIWETRFVTVPVVLALLLMVVGFVGYEYIKQTNAQTYSSYDSIPSSRTINGRVYTEDNPCRIVEVVPTGGTAQATWGWAVGGKSMPISIEDLDILYHTVGGSSYTCAFTDAVYKHYGSCKWTGTTVAGAGADKLETAKREMTQAFATTYNATFSRGDYRVGGYMLQELADGRYGSVTNWGASWVADGGWLGEFFYPNGDGTYTKTLDRNFLAHAFFEGTLYDSEAGEYVNAIEHAIDQYSDMTNKMVVQVVEADKLTKEIIDSADMVYIDSKCHNGATVTANDKFVELCNNNGLGSGGVTAGLTKTYSKATIKSGIEFSDTIAMYLYMQSATNDLAISVDTSALGESGGGFKFNCVALGIETDTFISEYAFKQNGENSYVGTNGRSYIDASGNWVIEQNDWTQNGGKLTWSYDMFVQSHGNYIHYPYYNGTTDSAVVVDSNGNLQDLGYSTDTMHKNIFAYKGSNQLDMSLLWDNASMNEGSRADVEDARSIFENSSVAYRQCMQYIMGLFGNNNKNDVRVAEVQPWGKYRYNTEDGARKILTMIGVGYDNDHISLAKSYDETDTNGNNTGYTVFEMQCYTEVGGRYYEADLYYVRIRSMSMNAFNGITEDLASTFDLIIMDSYDPDQYIQLTSASNNTLAQYIGAVNVGKAGKTVRTMSGNDLTDKMSERLYDYICTGMPIYFSRELYYGDVDTIDASATNLKSFSWTQLSTRLKADGKGQSNIITISGTIGATGDPDYKNFKCTSTARLQSKVDFSIVSPSPYVAEDASSLYAPANVKFVIKLLSEVEAGSTIKLYVDRNADALYNDDNSSALRELYAEIAVGSTITTGNYTINLDISGGTLPDTWFGYFKFKVEITSPKGIKSSQESAFALKPNKERTVYVLQVYNNKNGGGYNDTTASTLRMTSGTVFDDAFSAIYDITNMKLEVDVMDTVEFTAAVKENPDYLRPYSIVVMGFCDSYGKEGNPLTDQDVIDVLKDYVSENKSILFTHDCMTYSYSSGSDTLTENNMTLQMTEPIGMQGSGKLTNRLLMRLGGGFMSTFKDIAKSNGTKYTSKVDKLNWGQITEYPYAISSSIDVGETHEQFYRLNLEKIDTYDDDTGAVMSGVYNSYVTTWFTLGDDGSHTESNYYSLTGQDAINNYYIYSKGNITYTSAGHSQVDASGTITDEMRLFVNTLVRSIIVSVDPPTVEVTNGALVDTDEYEIIGRPGYYAEDGTWNSTTTSTEEGVAGTWNPASGIPLKFVVKDDIMAAGAAFAKGSIYVDVNNNGKYDAGTDYLLKEYGYGELLNETEVTEDIAALAQAAGCLNEVGNLYTSNQLKIGIKAENTVKTSAQAYARYIRRKYFDLG